MDSFNNKAIAITGGASGMGLALAKYIASRGGRVSIADVQENALNQAVDALAKVASLGSSAVLARQVDVRKTDQVDSWIEETKRTFGQLNGAANLAGISGRMGIDPIVDQKDDDWEFVMGVNATGLMYSLRAELRAITPGGSIVNASSSFVFKAGPTFAPYTASKHAVIGLSQCAAREVGAQGTRINCVAPGPVNTPMFHGTSGINEKALASMSAVQRIGEPEEVAALIAFLLGDESKYITGAVYIIDGGLGI
ncbi:hypothetical protein Plec18167_009096 [Paecilomyces lecythidis]|uniref:Ketoreductase domain-containing protein n=1 Tax=Paecilomyces lecythidis TaxID=3004212 RepID=A0ABR3WRH8_9EURO